MEKKELDFSVWYPSKDITNDVTFEELKKNPKELLTNNFIQKNYHCVYQNKVPKHIEMKNETIVSSFLKRVFNTFNSSDNPLRSSENQKVVKKYDLHTSMKISDIIKLENNHYYVDKIGFKKI